MVTSSDPRVRAAPSMVRRLKRSLSFFVSIFLRLFIFPWHKWQRLYFHAQLSTLLAKPLDESVIVLGKTYVYGTCNIRLGQNILLYPNLHLETQLDGSIDVGDNVVLSCGVHLVSMSRITIGEGSMIGEFSSIRDADHARRPEVVLRDSGYTASPITIGREVWIGRGVTVLAGVSIGDRATVGANAVVTRDVPAGVTVVGVPARPIRTNTAHDVVPRKPKNIDQDQADNFYQFIQGPGEISSFESE
jgi:acetyltransferase-like isoleucine patch superfamily enzyme